MRKSRINTCCKDVCVLNSCASQGSSGSGDIAICCSAQTSVRSQNFWTSSPCSGQRVGVRARVSLLAQHGNASDGRIKSRLSTLNLFIKPFT